MHFNSITLPQHRRQVYALPPRRRSEASILYARDEGRHGRAPANEVHGREALLQIHLHSLYSRYGFERAFHTRHAAVSAHARHVQNHLRELRIR